MFDEINLNSSLINDKSILKNSDIYYNSQENSNSMETNFLKILVEQVKNQDPINPISNSDLTSQLSQIKTAVNVQKIENIIEYLAKEINLKKFLNKPYFNNNIIIPSSKFTYDKKYSNIFLGAVLHQDSTEVNVIITDQNGKIVLSKNIGPLNAGVHKIKWDGNDILGRNVPKGEYQLSVIAKEGTKLLQVEPITFFNIKNINLDSTNESNVITI